MSDDYLSPRELRRYGKQIMIPEIGSGGQEKLKKASVLVVGAGGLGCPVLLYLVAAGIGNVGIAEPDKIEEANLPRQILYGSDDLGKLKSITAKLRLEQMNPFVHIEVFNLRFDVSNALKMLADYDIVVDATDNLLTRYIINDSSVILNKPMVHGAVFNSEGQVSVFNYRGGATYRCYNPYSDQENFMNPLPADSGLFGALTGMTGALMANEVIKIITETGEILSGRMLIFNILTCSFRSLGIKNIPENHLIRTLGEMPGIS